MDELEEDTTANVTLTVSEIRDSEFNLYQSVLMDHEYEFYTPWNDVFMDEGTQGSVSLSNLNSQHEVETGDPLISIAVDGSNIENDLQQPSSPTTSSLREILQFVYKETQVEGQEIIPYDEYRINSHDNDILNPNPDILSEIETSSINSTSNPSLLHETVLPPSSINSPSEFFQGKVHDKLSDSCSSSSPSSTELLHLRSLIENPVNRKERFLSGLKHLSRKIQLMRMRTGASAKVMVEMEEGQYFLDPSNTFTRLIHNWDLNHPSSIEEILTSEETPGSDDHRYAARMVTQTLSSPSVFDHQYNLRTSDKNTPGVMPSGHTIAKPSFEKRAYERNKSFQRHLYVLFSEVVQQLEDQTGATIFLTVYYQNTIFTKSNYKDASQVFKNRRRVVQFPVHVTKLNETESRNFSNKFKVINPSTFYIPMNIGRCHQGQSSSSTCLAGRNQEILEVNSILPNNFQKLPSSSPTIEIHSDVDIHQQPNMSIPVVPTNETAINSNPVCVKCHSSTPSSEFPRGDDHFIAWIRCNDPLCQYLVHAACIGFFVSNRKTLNRLPPFFCEAHRNF